MFIITIIKNGSEICSLQKPFFWPLLVYFSIDLEKNIYSYKNKTLAYKSVRCLHFMEEICL